MGPIVIVEAYDRYHVGRWGLCGAYYSSVASMPEYGAALRYKRLLEEHERSTAAAAGRSIQ